MQRDSESDRSPREGNGPSGASGAGHSARAPLKPAYLILGDDLPKIELALRRLKARIVREAGSDLNIDEFDAAVDGAAQVVNAANTLAFLSGTRLVLVRGVQAWLKADKELVARYVAAPAPDACLALVTEKLPPSDVLRVPMEKHGEVLEYRAPKEGQLPSWLVQQAGGCSFAWGRTRRGFWCSVAATTRTCSCANWKSSRPTWAATLFVRRTSVF